MFSAIDPGVNGSRLHRLSLDDGRDTVLMESSGAVGDASPAISPDGRRLGFARYDIGPANAVLMMQELGPGFVPSGAPVKASGVPRDVDSPVWSPDSTRVVFIEGGAIREWTVGGAVRPLYTGTGTISAMSVSWIPAGGARVAVAASRPDYDLWVLPLNPGSRTPTAPAVRLEGTRSSMSEDAPRLSPDGSRIVFVSDRSGTKEVWVADSDGGHPRQLSRLGAFIVGFPRWSPDGRQIAFHARVPDEAYLYVLDADAGAPRRLGPGTVPSWSQDGKSLWAQDGVNRVVRVRVADGQAEPLFAGHFPQETADGTRLLYAQLPATGIFARSLDGDVTKNPEQRLVEDFVVPACGFFPVANGFYYTGIAPDGKVRAFRFYDYSLARSTDIAPTPPNVANALSVSPDGRRLAYSAAEADSGVDLLLLEFDRPGR